MRTQYLTRALLTAIPHEGEVRLGEGDTKMLLTRHDRPYTMISVIAEAAGRKGWLTLELDGKDARLHHPKDVDFVEKTLAALKA